jgi:hypothetical protein
MADPVPHFVDLLKEWSYNIPFSTQWAVSIDINDGIKDTIQKVKDLESVGGDDKNWNFTDSVNILTKDKVSTENNVHCFFVESVSEISESFSPDSASFENNGGLIPGLISRGRSGYHNRSLKIGFRDTNVSFADFLIRPWVIAAAYLGRIADGENEIKANINVYHFTRNIDKKNKRIRFKTFNYYGCTPVGVDAPDYDYSKEDIVNFKTTWVFDTYGVEDYKTIKPVESPDRAARDRAVEEFDWEEAEARNPDSVLGEPSPAQQVLNNVDELLQESRFPTGQ